MAETNASDLKARLREYLDRQQWALFYEVPNGTGSNIRRYADAVAINLWPSQGHTVCGYEIKVTASDLNRELEQPAKADLIASFCDYWYLVTPPGLLKQANLPLPASWGLLEARGPTLRRAVAPKKNEAAKPLTRGFVASLLRREQGKDDLVIEHEVRQRVEAALKERRESGDRERVRLRQDLQAAQSRIANFEKATGVQIESWRPPEQMAAAIMLVDRLGLARVHGDLATLLQSLDSAKRQIQTAVDAFDLKEAA